MYSTIGRLFVFLLILNSLSAHGRGRGPHFYHCSNPSNIISPYYISCLQTNFQILENAFNGHLILEFCNDPGEKLNDQFTDCVERNFRRAQKTLIDWGIPMYITNCYAGKRGNAPSNYQSCLNNNFNAFSLVP